MATLTPNKGNARKIKHLRFEFTREEDDPLRPGEKRRLLTQARQNDIVEIPFKEDRSRGERFGAFFTDEELADAPPAGVRPLAERSTQELIEWLRTEKPNVEKTVEAAGTDAALAQRLLDAEAAASDGDPRDGVLTGLSKVIDAATS